MERRTNKKEKNEGNGQQIWKIKVGICNSKIATKTKTKHKLNEKFCQIILLYRRVKWENDKR